jgi:hypothetical protein
VHHLCGERMWFDLRLSYPNILISNRSTHNTRIERLWLESGRHFARGWRAFFHRLERLHLLDRDDPHHIWLLHTLFLEDIQQDCTQFCLDWNSHPLSGKAQNMSPLVRSQCEGPSPSQRSNRVLLGHSIAWSNTTWCLR